ncbi:MAG: hypothetical protein O9346_16425 [Leptospiraceae bacterium]|nr:hypothetical protein [Leptospiraceae bacterium]MCZ8348000.1 hypothetical protein [Leptospiraceae bacterium]PJE02648.1 MAG: hypothetical protein CK427_07130 [Leptospira sp.]
MAHYALLVIGLDVHEQIAPYYIHSEAESYPMYLQEFEILKIEKLYGVRRENIIEFSQALENFTKMNSGYNDDGYFYLSNLNPRGKWKYYEIGGRWSGILRLKENLSQEAILKNHIIENQIKNGAKIRNPEMLWEDTQILKPSDDKLSNTFHSTTARLKDIDFARIEMVYDPKLKGSKYGNFLGYAFLKDYKWFDKGRLGVQAYPDVSEKTDASWILEWTELLDTVAEEEYLTVVDCEV